jgi:hypothetical protein
MVRRIVLALALAALAACTSTLTPHEHTPAAPLATVDAFSLRGDGGASAVVTNAELAAMPRVTLTVTQHGQQHAYEGVPLSALLARIGAPQGQALHGAAFAKIVVVTARDGYRAVFALTETDPSMQRGQIIVADKMDGAALSAEDGPLRLIVENDLRPARSVRMLSAIEVRTVR